jgi:glycosyltransferase involved in cell wall biosynthesis
MKAELHEDFGIAESKVSVIPFGINNTLPTTALTRQQARQALGVGEEDKALLFFGNIAPYKGLEYLVAAFSRLAAGDERYRLIIAGRPKGSEAYWAGVQAALTRAGVRDRTIEHAEFIPDEKAEVYFKAADVLVLPYTHVFQSGVLFLGYSFGLPAIVTDVGSMKEDIVEGTTGFVCRPKDATDLARAIRSFFSSELYCDLDRRKRQISNFANDQYSWEKAGARIDQVYEGLVRVEVGSGSEV